ncbi:D-amino-acid transaminase [Peribacillus saganii]|uniref:D-alanine aminotransferase n=1 Tax=Peribacillus saganii TaxID=2303992 RepID=A0A372LMW1_9BACI|nr:D-amino-acid transaminase [Peribacillus saganii]RFU68720.1 D-amino-acid transaminase [Peribacillus saganii]
MVKMILNGNITERTEIKIDLEDRGYQFGDGVYEVIRVYNGVLFTADEHLNRLEASARSIHLTMPCSTVEMKEQLLQLVEENKLDTGIIYLQITRGVSPRNHLFPGAEVGPVYIAYTRELASPTAAMENGVKTITVEDIRWLRCDIKSLNLLPNLLAKQKASENGCFEALQHRNGTVTEGSSSNVSIVVNGEVKTHPANNLILNGISRQVMIRLCTDNQIAVKEEIYTVEDLIGADEVFLTGTTTEVMPIIEIDGKKIGNGAPGPITRQIQTLFKAEIEKQCGQTAKI